MSGRHLPLFLPGRTASEHGVLATQHALHETLEITHGISDIFELGFYVFTSENPGNGLQFVGLHLRPRIRAPEQWGLPVGLSLSTEFGPTQRNGAAVHVLRIQTRHVSGPAASSARGRPATLRASFICP